MRLLDRYVLKNFLAPFLFCFLGFLAIWLVFDLGDNVTEFIEAKVSPVHVAKFYATQFPQIAVMSLPVGLLLALLYSLSRMSRSNELISMLGAGVSVSRVLLPLFIVGGLVTGGSLALNYKLAPNSEAIKKQVLSEIMKKKFKGGDYNGLLFRNRMANRTWYIEKMTREHPNDLYGIHITQQNRDGNITTKYYARRAIFDPEKKAWNLERGKTVHFDEQGNIVNEELWATGSNAAREITDWSETPRRIASASLDPQNLSVPELREYLQFNADFPETQLAPYRTNFYYRWARPWECLVVILIAAPLGIVYSRKGVLGGVAAAIFFYTAMLFVTNLLLALGKGDRIPALVAAWAPYAFFASLGLGLLRLRSRNRELPTFNSLFGKKIK
jgi:LPS export ABC transporter permease LptG